MPPSRSASITSLQNAQSGVVGVVPRARNGILAYLAGQFPNFNQTQLLQATAASWNLGPFHFSGNPDTIDVGSKPNGTYGATALTLMNCF